MGIKHFTLSVAIALMAIGAKAQVQYTPPTSHNFTLSLGGGVTTLYGDVPNVKPLKPAGRINFDYNLTPFIAAGIEGQYGRMAEGREPSAPSEGRPPLYMETSYYTGNINARIAVGQFNRDPRTWAGRTVNNIYVGAGVGYLIAKHENITRFFPETGEAINYIVDDSKDLLIPLNLGINVDLPKILGDRTITANLNYQLNQTLGETLDGYNFNRYTGKVSSKDAYSMLSLAIRIHFGRTE